MAKLSPEECAKIDEEVHQIYERVKAHVEETGRKLNEISSQRADRNAREETALTKACKSLRPAPPAGFTIGPAITPGVVSPEFKEKLKVLGAWPDAEWDALWHVDPAGDPLTAWLLSERPLTLWERCRVGWQLWRDGISKFPWPVKDNTRG